MKPLPRKVLKRDGSKENFDKSKIRESIRRAILAVEVPGMVDPISKAAVMLGSKDQARKFQHEVVRRISRLEKKKPVSIEIIQDIIERELHNDFGRGKSSFSRDPENLWMSYMLYRAGRSLIRSGLLDEKDFRNSTYPHNAYLDTLSWVRENSCDSKTNLNNWVKNDFPLLISKCEERSERALMEVANQLEERISEGSLKAILITGPSASGKTSTTRKALEILGKIFPNVHFRTLEVDNYFKSHDNHQKLFYKIDGKKVMDINYELPESYDLDLINSHLRALLNGYSVTIPKYDFSTGQRSYDGERISLKKNEILLIDCMHALSPNLTEAIPNENKFKLYIEAMSAVSNNRAAFPWTDIRLMRRMLRDVKRRGNTVAPIVWHWHLIRKGERFLLPYIFTADAIIDGGIPYELPILKFYLEKELKDLLPLFVRNEQLFDGRERLMRISEFFDGLAVPNAEYIEKIPGRSILREFIGGSDFFDKPGSNHVG